MWNFFVYNFLLYVVILVLFYVFDMFRGYDREGYRHFPLPFSYKLVCGIICLVFANLFAGYFLGYDWIIRFGDIIFGIF